LSTSPATLSPTIYGTFVTIHRFGVYSDLSFVDDVVTLDRPELLNLGPVVRPFLRGDPHCAANRFWVSWKASAAAPCLGEHFAIEATGGDRQEKGAGPAPSIGPEPFGEQFIVCHLKGEKQQTRYADVYRLVNP
jgi:hypothetical protein